MKTVIPMETILALIALEADDAEKMLGDANCSNDPMAAHVCGRVSAFMDVLARLKNLEDPSRLWAANLVAAEHQTKVREIVAKASEYAARKAALKDLVGRVGGLEDDDHRHMN